MNADATLVLVDGDIASEETRRCKKFRSGDPAPQDQANVSKGIVLPISSGANCSSHNIGRSNAPHDSSSTPLICPIEARYLTSGRHLQHWKVLIVRPLGFEQLESG